MINKIKGLTRAIPKTALPVVKVLRQKVRRPVLPKLDEKLYWIRKRPVGGFRRVCAMGLVRGCSSYPYSRMGFNDLAPDRAVIDFANWFDDQRDPKSVVDAIWGKSNKSS